MGLEKIEFTNKQGVILSGKLDFPEGIKPKAYAMFAHCFTCNQSLTAIKNISRALNRKGIAVLRFDFTGLGESEGDFEDTNFLTNVEDLIYAAKFLEENYSAPSLIIGHSLGGTAILMSAQEISSCKAVVTIGSPFEAKHILKAFEEDLDSIKKDGEAVVNIVGRKFKIKKQFIDNLLDTNMSDVIPKLSKPLLIFHSPVDKIVNIENARKIYQHAHHPKSFISLDQADHLLSQTKDSLYVGDVIGSWAEKYISLTKEEMEKSYWVDEKNAVIAKVESGFYTDILANGHPIVADEPISYGGTDLGPSPYDLLASSLAACTAMTLRLYLDKKQWNYETILVKVKHSKTHAEDCDDCESKNKKIDLFEREIKVEGNLDQAQQDRLIDIANKCPVHKTLLLEIKIETKLSD